MKRASEWPGKLLALLKSGNRDAAIAQIGVAPSVKDLKQLRTALESAGLAGRWPNVDTAIADNLAALSAPRLHRSP